VWFEDELSGHVLDLYEEDAEAILRECSHQQAQP
jgi:hypothetical protein